MLLILSSPSELLALSFLPSHILSPLIMRVGKDECIIGGHNVWVGSRCHFAFQTCGKTLSVCKDYVGVQETETKI